MIRSLKLLICLNEWRRCVLGKLNVVMSAVVGTKGLEEVIVGVLLLLLFDVIGFIAWASIEELFKFLGWESLVEAGTATTLCCGYLAPKWMT